MYMNVLQQRLVQGAPRGVCRPPLLLFFFFFDGYCSTVQGLLDWFEADLGFTELSFIRGVCRPPLQFILSVQTCTCVYSQYALIVIRDSFFGSYFLREELSAPH